MDRYPRDPRPLRIFFEYAHNRKPEPSRLAESDHNLLELALRRLPFLLETDPELAWLASPFIRDIETARRLLASYRADVSIQPVKGSIAAALNLGLINDRDAADELFRFAADAVLDKDLITEVFDLLRSEEGRDYFTQKLLSYTGIISFDIDTSGYAEACVYYEAGVIRQAIFDINRTGIADLRISFGMDSVPVSAEQSVFNEPLQALIEWERYPSVRQITLAKEAFLFRPADFQFAPVAFIDLGGSKNHAGLAYPQLAYQNIDLTRRTYVSFCASLRRPSEEFPGAEEEIFFERGIPRRAVETLNGKQVSITEFERGAPVIQHLDFDLDGRMETIRRFHRPGPAFEQTFNYRDLIASSESDWTGEGIYKTAEVFQQDGSVVYLWDMDGSGTMDYSE
jgi:hypothetical protein